MFRLALKFCESSNRGGGCSQLRVGLFYSILPISMISTFFCVSSHILLKNFIHVPCSLPFLSLVTLYVSHSLPVKKNHKWAGACEKGTYHICIQRRLRRANTFDCAAFCAAFAFAICTIEWVGGGAALRHFLGTHALKPTQIVWSLRFWHHGSGRHRQTCVTCIINRHTFTKLRTTLHSYNKFELQRDMQGIVMV